MAPILLLVLAFSGSAQELPWQDLDLSIEKDFSVSSDRVTLCRVRVVNRGQHSWPGSRVRFEAVALEGGVPMARERGRFGLSLAPHETLETVIAFPGLYTRFEVRPLFKDFEAGKSSSRRGARVRSTKKKPKKGA